MVEAWWLKLLMMLKLQKTQGSLYELGPSISDKESGTLSGSCNKFFFFFSQKMDEALQGFGV